MTLVPNAVPNLGRTGLDLDAWEALHPTTQALIERSCLGKTAMDLTEARRFQARLQIGKYRCPFCRAWHVGHGLSLVGMEALALAIRDFGGDRPADLPKEALDGMG